MPQTFFKVYAAPGYPVDPAKQLERESVEFWRALTIPNIRAEDYQVIGFDMIRRANELVDLTQPEIIISDGHTFAN